MHDLAVAIGCDPGHDRIDGLRYGKIVILADADSDGLHIATLLCALFVRHFPALVRAGHIFVAMPPLFRIDCGKQVFYALDEAEKRATLERIEREKMKGAVSVTRFKGLGEMNPPQLRESTVHPDTRRLVQLTIDDAGATGQVLDLLLALQQGPWGDGIPELLDTLSARRVPLAVLSNKPHLATRDMIHRLFGRWSFVEVQGAQDDLPLKPDPAGVHLIAQRTGIPAGRWLYLGDTDVDMQTARAAGCLAVGALWGSYRPALRMVSPFTTPGSRRCCT